jgi:hypothetical protein
MEQKEQKEQKTKYNFTYCKTCKWAKNNQLYRPALFCGRHRQIINDNTITTAILCCMGKDYEKRGTKDD